MSDSRATLIGYSGQALNALGAAVLVKSLEKDTGEARFIPVEPLPNWWPKVFGEVENFWESSPFLEDFLKGAAADFWRSKSNDRVPSFPSGIWEESVASGDKRYFFEAIACRGELGDSILIVLHVNERWKREQAFIQSAHEQTLSRSRAGKRLERMEILLKRIMHNLDNPLMTVLVNLQGFREQLGEDDEALETVVDRGIARVEQQRELNEAAAEVFAAELAAIRIECSPADVLEHMEETSEKLAACGLDALESVADFKKYLEKAISPPRVGTHAAIEAQVKKE